MNCPFVFYHSCTIIIVVNQTIQKCKTTIRNLLLFQVLLNYLFGFLALLLKLSIELPHFIISKSNVIIMVPAHPSRERMTT